MHKVRIKDQNAHLVHLREVPRSNRRLSTFFVGSRLSWNKMYWRKEYT